MYCPKCGKEMKLKKTDAADSEANGARASASSGAVAGAAAASASSGIIPVGTNAFSMILSKVSGSNSSKIDNIPKKYVCLNCGYELN